MKFSKFMLVTIVAERILAGQIRAEIQEQGANGITISEVKGEGNRHLNAGEVPGEKIKIECIVDATSARKIMQHIADKYFSNFSLIVYSQEVEILRSEKFKSVRGNQ